MNPSRSKSSAVSKPRASGTRKAVGLGNTPNSCAECPVPPQWTWHHRMLSALRDKLIAESCAFRTETKRAAQVRELTPVERAQLARLHRRLSAVDERVFEVDSALQRIYDDLYGSCEETGRPISPKRLRAMPWTRTAV